MYAQFNYIGELQITKNQALFGSHKGACDDDIAELRNLPVIRRQLNKIDKSKLVLELSEYGAWEENELQDHESNLDRILWIACGNIIDEQ